VTPTAPAHDRDSLAGLMSELRPLVRQWSKDETVRRWFQSEWANLEIIDYPAYASSPDPARGPDAVRRTSIPGKTLPRVPLRPDDLNLEAVLLRAAFAERRAREAAGPAAPPRMSWLLDRAIALNRTLWAQATIAEAFSRSTDDVLGRFLRVERERVRSLLALKIEVRWQSQGGSERYARLPSFEDAWMVLVGGQLPHVLQSVRFVVDFGASSFQSWAPCAACWGLQGSCDCPFCMQRLDVAGLKDPDLAARIAADPAIGVFAEYSTASGWGPGGDLSAMKRANPGFSAYQIRLESLFGREQIDAARHRFEGWSKPRASGKPLGSPPALLNEASYHWAVGLQIELGSLRKVHEEYLRRGLGKPMSFSAFERRFRATRRNLQRKGGVSAAPE
jgi:hypothetical protein